MSNGSRRNNKVESLSIESPKRGWVAILFDLLYPTVVTAIAINVALLTGYIAPTQLHGLMPPFLTNFLRYFS